jgi:hypothetical protein
MRESEWKKFVTSEKITRVIMTIIHNNQSNSNSNDGRDDTEYNINKIE